jgi:hypothetical protein
LLRLVDNIKEKGEIFPIDGDIIKDIFYPAYIKSAIMFQEKVETSSSSKKLAQTFSLRE